MGRNVLNCIRIRQNVTVIDTLSSGHMSNTLIQGKFFIIIPPVPHIVSIKDVVLFYNRFVYKFTP